MQKKNSRVVKSKATKASKSIASKKIGKNNKKRFSKASRAIIVALLVVISISVLITAYMYDVNNSASDVHLSVFLANMRSAPHMNIYVSSINNTVYVNSTYCATSLIYQIMKSNYTHRDPSTINFFVVNASNESCTYTIGLRNASNFTTSTSSKCVSLSKGIPSIFINYNKTNKTVVHNNALYIHGSTQYLLECGVSAQMR